MSEGIDVDWNDPSTEPGTREMTVKAVVHLKEGQPLRSKAGDKMLKLILKAEDGVEIHDYIMIEGKGAPMGTRKLKALGVQKGEKVVPRDLEGRRVNVECVTEDYQGETQLRAKKYTAIVGGEIPKQHDPVSDGLTPF